MPAWKPGITTPALCHFLAAKNSYRATKTQKFADLIGVLACHTTLIERLWRHYHLAFDRLQWCDVTSLTCYFSETTVDIGALLNEHVYFQSLKTMCCGVLCCGVLCCVVLWCVVLCCGVLCCGVLCCGVLCCVVLWCVVLCCVVLCCVVVCCVVVWFCCVVVCCVVVCCVVVWCGVLCCGVLCCGVLCCGVLCCGVVCCGVVCCVVVCCVVVCCVVVCCIVVWCGVVWCGVLWCVVLCCVVLCCVKREIFKLVPVKAWVPQGSVLGPLFFLIYINDLVDNVSPEAKLFSDDTSLFIVVYDVDIAADKLNRGLDIISNWAHQWKMQFNPDINKQAIQVIFSKKKSTVVHPPIFLMGLKLQLNWSITIMVWYSIPSSTFTVTSGKQ